MKNKKVGVKKLETLLDELAYLKNAIKIKTKEVAGLKKVINKLEDRISDLRMQLP